MDDPIYDKISEEEMKENDDSHEYEEESDQEENEFENMWNINIKEEEIFWKNFKINGFTYDPAICPNCSQGEMKIKKRIEPNLLNPFYMRCSYKKCRCLKNLRYYSFTKKFLNLPGSICFKILEEFFLSGLCSTKIKS